MNNLQEKPKITVPVFHTLKCDRGYFYDVASGIKTFEVRKNDRNFRKDDIIILTKNDPYTKEYEGGYCILKITYILQGGQYGVEQGYVVLGVQCIESNY